MRQRKCWYVKRQCRWGRCWYVKRQYRWGERWYVREKVCWWKKESIDMWGVGVDKESVNMWSVDIGEEEQKKKSMRKEKKAGCWRRSFQVKCSQQWYGPGVFSRINKKWIYTKRCKSVSWQKEFPSSKLRHQNLGEFLFKLLGYDFDSNFQVVKDQTEGVGQKIQCLYQWIKINSKPLFF